MNTFIKINLKKFYPIENTLKNQNNIVIYGNIIRNLTEIHHHSKFKRFLVDRLHVENRPPNIVLFGQDPAAIAHVVVVLAFGMASPFGQIELHSYLAIAGQNVVGRTTNNIGH